MKLSLIILGSFYFFSKILWETGDEWVKTVYESSPNFVFEIKRIQTNKLIFIPPKFIRKP